MYNHSYSITKTDSQLAPCCHPGRRFIQDNIIQHLTKKDNWIALYIEKFRRGATERNYSLSRFRQEAPGENSHAGILKQQR